MVFYSGSFYTDLFGQGSSGSMTQMAAEMSARVQDVAMVTFEEDTYIRALRAGVRKLYPQWWFKAVLDCGSVAAGSTSCDLPVVPPELGGLHAYRVFAVEYEHLGRWVVLAGAEVDEGAGTVNFPELSRARTIRVTFLVAVPCPEDSEELVPLPHELGQVAQDFAIAYLLDGYLAKRQYFDKYTVSGAGDAVTPYDVELAARHFEKMAQSRLVELARPLPVLRWR